MISSHRSLLNDGWFYREQSNEEPISIRLPHTNRELPLNYFSESDFQFTSIYERDLPPLEQNKRHFLQFDGVMTAFTLFLNEEKCGSYRGGYLPHIVEITPYVQSDSPSKLRVEVDSTERTDIPPFGGTIDFLTFGGIYRDLWHYTLDDCYIRNVRFDYEIKEINEDYTAIVICHPWVEFDHAGNEAMGNLSITVAGQRFEMNLKLSNGIHAAAFPAFELKQVSLWRLEHPVLYPAQFHLSGTNFEDSATIQIGFRSIEATANGFFLNGKAITLRGLNRHQSFPYVGYAMPRRAQEAEAKRLKRELGLNLVRTSHYPQSPWFLDECDRQGLLVLEEIPGWQHISQNSDWREQVLADVRGMIERDWNHPSIFTWGVRINESQDDDELYSRTNALARSLDSRPTSGVRNMEGSHLLEDIYTNNDFSYSGEEPLRPQKDITKLPHSVPYLVTEFCGHNYPTLRQDQEARLIEHALSHARIQSAAEEREDILGAVGWCAFDYNTHYNFGFGDHICYHGVMDAFRIPKFAAAVYKSQRPASDGWVLEPLTWWTRATSTPIYVFTNCEEVEYQIGNCAPVKLTRSENCDDPLLRHLKHPPFILRAEAGDWGWHFHDLTITGFTRGQEVCKRKFSSSPIYSGIEVQADDAELYCNELDVTRIVIRCVDQVQNQLPYLSESFDIEAAGDVEIIGPHRLSAVAGAAAFWVRTTADAKPGIASISVRAYRGFETSVALNLTPRS